MAESGVIVPSGDVEPGLSMAASRSASPSVEAAIVIIPSDQAAAWTGLIRDAAIQTGHRLVDLRDIDSGHLADIAGDTIVIAGDLTDVQHLDAAFKTLVMTSVGSSTQAAAADGSATPVVDASLALSGSALADEGWCILTDTAVARVTTVQLWPGAVIAPPGPSMLLRDAGRDPLACYRDGPPKVGAKARWTPSLFSYDDRRLNRAQPAIIDLTGPARALVFGPYVWLTPGEWTAVARFSVDEDAVNHELRFEWGTTTAYSQVTATPRVAGVYDLTLSYTWPQACQAEFRIILAQGSLGGVFEFLGLDVKRTA